jgi:hypothetical protein
MSRHLMARFRHLYAATGGAQNWDWKHKPNDDEAARMVGYGPEWHSHVPHGDGDVWYIVRQLGDGQHPTEENFSVHGMGERVPSDRPGIREMRRRHPNAPHDDSGYPLPLGYAHSIEEAKDVAGKFHADNYQTFSDKMNDGGYDINQIMREQGF